MRAEFGLYSKVNEFPFYMPDALTPSDVFGEIKIVSDCKHFDRYKKLI